ncbi:MAG: transglycosylase domain-containing protein [Candidatus Limnocylindria bacterium]
MHPALQRRRRHLMMTRRTTRRGARRRGLATFLLLTLGVFGLMFAGSVLGTTGGMFAAYAYFSSDLPDPHVLDGIRNELPQSTYVYDRTGQTLLARFECQNREAVAFNQIPEVIWQAAVASEDQTFWENSGIDVQGIMRAAIANLEAGEIVQGASTITQQVIDYARVLREEGESTQVEEGATPAPSVVVDPDVPATEEQPTEEAPTDVCEPPAPPPETGFDDKIREQILAMNVTNAYPGREGKELILETYLNLIYYGHGSYGIKAAAANFFGLADISQITVAQAAFLAALPQAPSALDPYQSDAADGTPRGPAAAIRERDLVLGRMLAEGYITNAQYREAVATTWEQMNPSRLTSVLLEPHFSFRVREEAGRILASLGVENPELAVRTGGYRIITTLDYNLQQVAHEQVRQWVAALADKNVNNGALVAINSATGEIVSYVGSIDYYNREDPRVQGQFDVAGLGRRQPGSAFKPITYTSAFQSRDATVSTMLVDAITEFGLREGSSYRPTNADIRERGPVLAVDALRYSLNIPSVQMQYLVGSPTTATFAEKLGIASADYIMAQDPGLSLALGSVPVNLTNMTQAYGTFAQQGTLHPATTVLEIRDRNNRVVYTREDGIEPTNPMTAAEAYLTHWILEGNTDPKRNVLWGSRALLTDVDGQRRTAAFKTGTTNDFRDVSGFGYIPGSLVTGVWMGNNNQEPMSNELGQGLFSADGPLFLWHDFMERAINEPWEWNGGQPVPQTSFDMPAGVVMEEVCRWSGMGKTSACGGTLTVPFLEGTVPPLDNVHPTGCLDLELYVSTATPARPGTWVTAADTWSDRMVNGQFGSSGNPADYQTNPNVRFAISPLYGEGGFTAICGERVATPEPSPTPGPSGGGGGGGGNCPPGQRPCPTPTPTPQAGGGTTALAPGSLTAAGVAPGFGIATLLAALLYARFARRRRQGRT